MKALLCLLLAAPLCAQTITGTNTTTVKDSQGGVYTTSTPYTTSTVTSTVFGTSTTTYVPPAVVTPALSPYAAPSTAIASVLSPLTNWKWEHDTGTPGTSTGSSVYGKPGHVSGTYTGREFYMTYASKAGERWHVSFATDTTHFHFIYDTWYYVTDPSQVQNLELDMNRVDSSGRTIIYGVQCASGSQTWEYTLLGSSGGFGWHPSNIPCNPHNMTANAWHHIRIASHDDNAGHVTYDWVELDGNAQNFSGAYGNDAKNLGWAVGDLLINFQMEGQNSTSGSITAYADALTVYRW